MSKQKTIHEIALGGRYKTLCAAIRAGADVNSLDENDATPIMYAIAANRTTAVDTLIGAGANVPANYPNGDCVLTRTVSAGNVQMTYKVIYDLKNRIPAAREHCTNRDVQYVLDLVEHGEAKAKELWRADFPPVKRAKERDSEIVSVMRAFGQPTK